MRTAKVDDVNTFHRLRSVPGIGKVLALVLLYEIRDVGRFARVGNTMIQAELAKLPNRAAQGAPVAELVNRQILAFPDTDREVLLRSWVDHVPKSRIDPTRPLFGQWAG